MAIMMDLSFDGTSAIEFTQQELLRLSEHEKCPSSMSTFSNMSVVDSIPGLDALLASKCP